MTFTFPILLGGLLLLSIPVLLHLLMRQKPKTVLFPAFRFLVQRSRTNLTKLRLRHLLLMALRMLLLAAIIFALARPKLRENPWALPSDQAVAAVFVLDTSASMEYTVAASQTRLKDAQKRAIEMLDLLPDNSEVVVLDSAESTPLGQGDWLSRDKAAERIGQLTLQPSSGPVSTRVATAFDFLTRTAAVKDESQRGKRPRLLCVFSDQTIASWDVRERRSLQALANAVPPNFERLEAIRSGFAEQEKLLAQLPERLPSVSQSFSEQALVALLGQLGDRLYQASSDDYPDAATQNLIAAARAKQQELLALIGSKDVSAGNAEDYRGKLQTALQASLQQSAGFIAFFVDVGVERPVDLAVNELQLIRELPASGGSPIYILQGAVKATGEDMRSTIAWHLAGVAPEHTVEARKDQRERIALELDSDKIKLGHHQAKVIALPPDQLPINNSRFLTYAFRPVLVLAEPSVIADARTWAFALESNNVGAAWYRSELKNPSELGEPAAGMFDKYAAVFLYALKDPGDKLWAALSDYVGNGGGVGIVPGKDLKLASYNDKAAQELLPASFEQTMVAKGGPVDWSWTSDIFKHPLLHPYQEWRQAKWDFVVSPRGARMFWKVEPRKEQSNVLVRYSDGKESPALIERIVDLKRGRAGRVLLFTSPPGWPEWNNYAENSFYLTLAWRSIGYLTGDDDRPALNFICGEGIPSIPVPIRGQAVAYKLYRDGPAPPAAMLATVTAEQGQNEVRVPQAIEPGNYRLQSSAEDAVAWFSVNLPALESDLGRTPREEIEAILGRDTVVTIDARTDFKTKMQGHISNPWELMPMLMLALLVLLALENLLANKFYRREPAPMESSRE